MDNTRERQVHVLPGAARIILIIPTSGLRAASLRGSWWVWP